MLNVRQGANDTPTPHGNNLVVSDILTCSHSVSPVLFSFRSFLQEQGKDGDREGIHVRPEMTRGDSIASYSDILADNTEIPALFQFISTIWSLVPWPHPCMSQLGCVRHERPPFTPNDTRYHSRSIYPHRLNAFLSSACGGFEERGRDDLVIFGSGRLKNVVSPPSEAGSALSTAIGSRLAPNSVRNTSEWTRYTSDRTRLTSECTRNTSK